MAIVITAVVLAGVQTVRLQRETRELIASAKTAAEKFGGEGGIRTPGTVPRTLDFESSAFNRARPPLRFLGLAFSQPEAGKKFGEQSRRLLSQHAAGRGKLMIEPLILT